MWICAVLCLKDAFSTGRFKDEDNEQAILIKWLDLCLVCVVLGLEQQIEDSLVNSQSE